MSTDYPGAIDALTNPTGTDQTTSPDHAAQHANANDAIEAIETELGTDPAGAFATVKARLEALEDDEASWTAPTLTNSWVNVGAGFGTAGYRKDAHGFVHIKGAIKSGTIGQAAFTLPTGYRPEASCRFACVSNSAFGSLTITSAGVVTPNAGTTASFMLDGVNFLAEN